ncbi:hypothetical protein WN55_02087 [Dufourea novaeangliae]|uniref:Uncharacterized protein n=1 Tax=Dufourea novaeangliae TaxID=178035 RepID=A0A154NYV5_DUFNO|nr:hypothetical protein WN55_02087 [Dufourea novaeangliae]
MELIVSPQPNSALPPSFYEFMVNRLIIVAWNAKPHQSNGLFRTWTKTGETNSKGRQFRITQTERLEENRRQSNEVNARKCVKKEEEEGSSERNVATNGYKELLIEIPTEEVVAEDSKTAKIEEKPEDKKEANVKKCTEVKEEEEGYSIKKVAEDWSKGLLIKIPKGEAIAEASKAKIAESLKVKIEAAHCEETSKESTGRAEEKGRPLAGGLHRCGARRGQSAAA